MRILLFKQVEEVLHTQNNKSIMSTLIDIQKY